METITYGAPAAHVFKFKDRGLSNAEAKLAKNDILHLAIRAARCKHSSWSP